MSVGRFIGVVLGALFFAALLWSYVYLSNSYESEVDLPIELVPPKGHGVISGLPERIHARVRGAGWQLLSMDFAHNARFKIDLTARDLSEMRTHVGIGADELAGYVVVPSEVKLVKFEPDSLEIHFAPSVQRRLAIAPQMVVQTAPGYITVGSPQPDPPNALVIGAPAVLDSIGVIKTETTVETGIRQTFTKKLELSKSYGNALRIVTPQTVSVRVDVQAVAERQFAKLPVILDAVPPEVEVLLTPPMVDVVLRGGVERLGKLPRAQVSARIVYDPLLFDSTSSLKPVIHVPADIEVLSVQPERVAFVVRKRRTSSR